jgi:hypothetical protein
MHTTKRTNGVRPRWFATNTIPNNIIEATTGQAIMDGTPPSTNTGRMTLKPVNATALGIRKANVIYKTESCFALCHINMSSDILLTLFFNYFLHITLDFSRVSGRLE